MKNLALKLSRKLVDLFRLPAVAAAIACLLMLHFAYYITTGMFQNIGLPLKAETIAEREFGRNEYAEAIHEALHSVGREVAIIAWLIICTKIALKFW